TPTTKARLVSPVLVGVGGAPELRLLAALPIPVVRPTAAKDSIAIQKNREMNRIYPPTQPTAHINPLPQCARVLNLLWPESDSHDRRLIDNVGKATPQARRVVCGSRVVYGSNDDGKHENRRSLVSITERNHSMGGDRLLSRHGDWFFLESNAVRASFG